LFRACNGIDDELLKQYIKLVHARHTQSFRNDVFKMMKRLRTLSDTHEEYQHKDDKMRCKYESIYTGAWKVAVWLYDRGGKRLGGLDEHYFMFLEARMRERMDEGKLTEGEYLLRCKELKKERDHDIALNRICIQNIAGKFQTHTHSDGTKITVLIVVSLPAFLDSTTHIV